MTSQRTITMEFFFASRRRPTSWTGDWSSDLCSSDLPDRREAKDRNLDQRHKRGDGFPAVDQIGRASCRKECRSRWSPYHSKKKKKKSRTSTGRPWHNSSYVRNQRSAYWQT